jgi:hypothetical protein
MKRLLVGVGFLIALPLFGCSVRVSGGLGPGPASGSVSEKLPARRIEAGAEPKVVVDSPVGNVTLVAGRDGVVEVFAEKVAPSKEDLAKIQVITERAGDGVRVSWRAEDQVTSNRSVAFRITAPKRSSLRLSTGSGGIALEGFERGAQAETGVGSISVKDVKGELKVHTGSGAIGVTGADGPVAAITGVGAIAVRGPRGSRALETGSGAISVTGGDGKLSARSGVGAITVKDAKGELSLHTGSGAITVTGADGSVTAEANIGSVEVEGRLSGRNVVGTGSGRVRVAVPADSRLKVDVSTGSGSLANEFGLPVEGRVSRVSRGTLADGSGGSLQIRSGVGGVALTKLK